MRKIYCNHNATLVWHAKNILEAAGIECVLRNEFASGGVGQLSPFDAWPELWVEDNVGYRAQTLLKTAFAESELPEWICPQCGETSGGAFVECWNCSGDSAVG